MNASEAIELSATENRSVEFIGTIDDVQCASDECDCADVDGYTDVWGTSTDGAPFRLRLLVRCECGKVTGERCEWTGPRTALRKYTYVPAWLQGTADACGSSRGMESTIMVTDECADMLSASDDDNDATDGAR